MVEVTLEVPETTWNWFVSAACARAPEVLAAEALNAHVRRECRPKPITIYG